MVILVLDSINRGPSHDRGDIGEDVAQASIEDQAINGLLKGLRAQESKRDESSSTQGQSRSNALQITEGRVVRAGEIVDQHLGG